MKARERSDSTRGSSPTSFAKRREVLRALCALPLLSIGCRRPGQGQRVYVTNEDSGDVTVIDAADDRVVATIPVGKRPRGVRVDHPARRLYVAVSGSPKVGPTSVAAALPPADAAADGIAVVDLDRRVVLTRLASGPDPAALALLEGAGRLFVSNEETAGLSLVNVTSGELERTLGVGIAPEGVELRPDGEILYVTSEGSHRIDVITVASFARVAIVETGLRPRAIAFSPGGERAFVTNELGASLTVIDSAAHRRIGVIELPLVRSGGGGGGVPPRPMGIVVSPNEQRAYVTTGRGGSVAVIDTEDHRVLTTIERVGARPWGIGITADGRKLYTANGPSNDVSVIDVRSRQVLRRIPVGRSPWGIAIERV